MHINLIRNDIGTNSINVTDEDDLQNTYDYALETFSRKGFLRILNGNYFIKGTLTEGSDLSGVATSIVADLTLNNETNL